MDNDPFGSTLCFSARLPFAFRQHEGEWTPETLAHINAANQQVLNAEATIAESHRLIDAKDEERPWLADMVRLENKLDMLTALVGQLLARDASVPPATSVRLFANGLEWLGGDSPPPAGASGVITLYVNPAFPQPLQLPGTVRSHRAEGRGHWVRFEFLGQSPAVVDLLEKMLFRHHRRQVAEARAAGHSGR
jgi:hypothetical protein